MPAGSKVYAGTLAQDEMLLHSFGSVILNSRAPDDFPDHIYQNTGPSWFGGQKEASLYAFLKGCPECIYVFTLKEDTNLIVLPNAYNLAKLVFMFSTGREEDDEVVDGLYEMFPGLDQLIEDLTQSGEYYMRKDPVRWLTIEMVQKSHFNIKRLSHGDVDFGVSYRLMQLFKDYKLKYSGYMAPAIKKVDSGFFHEEVMFFNPYTTLERDVSDPLDASNTAVKMSAGPALQEFRKKLETRGRLDDNTQWDYTVWSLLYAEKVLARYRRSDFLNLDSSDARFIAFATLVHEVYDGYEELARELGVTLDHPRREILLMVHRRYDQFEDIVDLVAENPEEYIQDSGSYLFNVEIPPCDDFREQQFVDKCNAELIRDMRVFPKDKLLSLLDDYFRDLNPLQLTTLVIVSIAHVLGMTPYGRGRVTTYGGSKDLKNLVASSQYFPINNQYRSAKGSPERSMTMRKIGIMLGQITLIQRGENSRKSSLVSDRRFRGRRFR